MQSYPNYVNLRDVFEQNHDRLRKESLSVSKVMHTQLYIGCFSTSLCCYLRPILACQSQRCVCTCRMAAGITTFTRICRMCAQTLPTSR